MITFAVPISRDTYWRDARVAEEARLESVCTPKGYREFESRSLRFIFGQKPLLSTFRGGFLVYGSKINAPKMHQILILTHSAYYDHRKRPISPFNCSIFLIRVKTGQTTMIKTHYLFNGLVQFFEHSNHCKCVKVAVVEQCLPGFYFVFRSHVLEFREEGHGVTSVLAHVIQSMII